MQKVTLRNKDVRWRERVTVGGVKKNITGRTKAEVENAIRQMKEKERRRKLGIPEPMEAITFDGLCQKMLDRYMQRPQSKKELTETLVSTRAHFGSWKLTEITAGDVEDWLAAESRKPGAKRATLSPSTLRRRLYALRQVLKYGVEHGYLARNVAAQVKAPAPADAADPFTSWDEVRAVATALGNLYTHGYALVMFVCSTGLRPQEWQVLRWSDIDLKEGVVYIARTWQKCGIGEDHAGKTKGSLAPVQLPGIAVDALKTLPRTLDRNALVFPDPDGGIWNLNRFRETVWTKALLDAGVPHRGPKQMRHTFATLGLAAGAPLEWIGRQMRHADLETTRRHYARWIKGSDTRWVNALDAHAAGELETKEVNG